MALHPIVTKTLRRVVKQAKQPNALSNRLEAWLNAVSEDDVALQRKDEVARNIEFVLDEIVVDPTEDGEG